MLTGRSFKANRNNTHAETHVQQIFKHEQLKRCSARTQTPPYDSKMNLQHIKKIRLKFGKIFATETLHTVHGNGW
jgi:hypothetical protein